MRYASDFLFCIYLGCLNCQQLRAILFMPESTEGISEGQTTAMSGKND